MGRAEDGTSWVTTVGERGDGTVFGDDAQRSPASAGWRARSVGRRAATFAGGRGPLPPRRVTVASSMDTASWCALVEDTTKALLDGPSCARWCSPAS